MDYGDFNAPMYFDFEMMKQGVEEDVEGDEWFGELWIIINKSPNFKIFFNS